MANEGCIPVSQKKGGWTMKKRCLILAGFLIAATPAFASENVFRCGSNIVEKGDSMATVQTKCGEPMMKNAITSGSGTAVRQEVWNYNCGDGNFNYMLTFWGTTLQDIKRTDERGSGVADWNKAR